MGWFKRLVKGLRIKRLRKGAGVGWSTGKPFNPYDQERTTPAEDFNKAKEEETAEMLDKIVNKEE